jgi:hypothetical protein
VRGQGFPFAGAGPASGQGLVLEFNAQSPSVVFQSEYPPVDKLTLADAVGSAVYFCVGIFLICRSRFVADKLFRSED